MQGDRSFLVPVLGCLADLNMAEQLKDRVFFMARGEYAYLNACMLVQVFVWCNWDYATVVTDHVRCHANCGRV